MEEPFKLSLFIDVYAFLPYVLWKNPSQASLNRSESKKYVGKRETTKEAKKEDLS